MTRMLIVVAAGGAIGAVMRFLLGQLAVYWLGRDFPYGTLLVNVLGSFLIGVLYVVLMERLMADPMWRAFLVVGLLGSLTTFSTFSIETLHFFEHGAGGRALANIAANLGLCLLACWAGLSLVRQL